MRGLVQQRLPVLEHIQAFVMRGAWNLMRLEDWDNIERALPAISEWHCAWTQQHINAYSNMIHILNRLPVTIRHLNIGLEGFYSHDDWYLAGPPEPQHSLPQTCTQLGNTAPHLESFTFTGRLCRFFFEALKETATVMGPRSRLRSVDIVVKACCHSHPLKISEHDWVHMSRKVSGITSKRFIGAFVTMVIKAIECLSVLPALEYMQIRFVDPDLKWGPLKPYFQLMNDECTGLWSDDILEALCVNRPSASFVELTDGVDAVYDGQQRVGTLLPLVRPPAIQVSVYDIFTYEP
jgi:hypothetical protein